MYVYRAVTCILNVSQGTIHGSWGKTRYILRHAMIRVEYVSEGKRSVSEGKLPHMVAHAQPAGRRERGRPRGTSRPLTCLCLRAFRFGGMRFSGTPLDVMSR